ncbi:MAG: hypothetical protein ACOYN0_16290 [Phycisphaerales bacterium]
MRLISSSPMPRNCCHQRPSVWALTSGFWQFCGTVSPAAASYSECRSFLVISSVVCRLRFIERTFLGHCSP